MEYAVCIVPLAPVRLAPDHREEMTSQYLFGETAGILEKTRDGWLKLEDSWDNYPGWCRANQFVISGNEFPKNNIYAADWVNEIYINHQKISIPFASSLTFLENKLPGLEITYTGKLLDARLTKITKEYITGIAAVFLGTAYLWGGKTVFGVDCSGFVQTVFRLMNIRLKRDANQQVEQGAAVGFLQEAICGDLAFFDDPDGFVVHVGILLNDHEIIHSSGSVRIDKIDNEGIVHMNTGLRTHRLRTIKRII